MTKAARLLKILTILGARRFPVTGEVLAQELGVSLRTVYRDIEELRRTGADIFGEAGFGYLLTSDAHIPPLNFVEDEIYAVLTGLEMVCAFTDDDMQAQADSARQKIMNVLDDRRKSFAENLPYRAPQIFSDENSRKRHAQLREAILSKSKLDITYISLNGQTSQRTIWPLGLIAWFGKWTLLAWCEQRQDYRSFRVDKIVKLEKGCENFQLTKDLNLNHFLENIATLPNDR